MASRNSPMVVPSRPRRPIPKLPPVVPEITQGPIRAFPEPRGANPFRIREVACLTNPTMHAEGEHALNFITDTAAMLDSKGDHLTIRERRFLQQALHESPRPDSFRPGAQVLTMTDRQWTTWERLRDFHLIALRLGPKAHAGPLSIPLSEAVA